MNHFSGIFWGAILIIGGVLFIIKHFINIDIPVIRILFGVLLVYWGMSIIFSHSSTKAKIVVKSNNESKIVKIEKNKKEYNVVFGSSTIDFSDIDKINNGDVFEINCVFSNTIINIPEEIDYSVEINTAFGEVNMQGENIGMFSNQIIEKDTGKKKIHIILNTVFGKTEIRKIGIERREENKE